MMCNMTYVECRYSMLNGLIDSREVRRATAVGSSRSSGVVSQQSSRQDAVDDARLQAVAKLEQIHWGCTTSQHIEKMFYLVVCGCIKLNFEGACMVKTIHLLVIFEILWVHLHPPEYM
jgi:hypothetical protein